MAAQYLQFTAVDFVLVLEKSARWWTGGMRSILIKCASMAGTHEQSRFLKPTNRAAQSGCN
jgi:hypothetical protein